MRQGRIALTYAPELVGDDVEEWRDEAACRIVADPDKFFPEDGTVPNVVPRMCAGCPVAAECLQYALDNKIDHGYWGGVSGAQRIRMRRGAA